jgi:uncharacterized membrane protein
MPQQTQPIAATTHPLLFLFAAFSLLLNGAIFGFFYAWVCSTMWGLDAADPAVAIAAMQAMNRSVRNAVFFPAFFLTPVVLLVTAWLAQAQHRRVASLGFVAAAVVYFIGGLIATIAVNVPMNEALAVLSIPITGEAAGQIWQAYSGPWQVWNILRTLASGIALMLTGYARVHLQQETA